MALNNDDLVIEPEITEHVNLMFTSGTLPAPTGNVPPIIHGISLEDQRQQSEQLFTFLTEESPNLNKLNEDIVPRTILISVPRSKMIKLVYCGGMGSSPIGTNSDIDGNYLFLSGDAGNELGSPLPVIIPTPMHLPETVFTMTHNQFSAAFTTKGVRYTYPLLQRNAVTTTTSVMKLAPIPAYLVYDGFNTNIDAAEVYERVLSVADHSTPTFTHLKNFLLACLCSHNMGDPKPWVPQEHFMQPISASARRWSTKKFKHVFPTLVETPPAIVPAGLNPEIAALLATALARTHPPPPPPAIRNEEEKKGDDTMGMSENELEDILSMCGKARDSDPALLPNWIQECAKKGSENYKLTVIMKQIMNQSYYDDAEVPITRPLLKMILKRQWTGKDGNITRPSMATSSEGLSPFAVLDLDEDAVARINDADDALTRASLMTFQDLKKIRNANKSKVPESSDEFMLTLKRFANLLFSIFSDDCPYFKCVQQIIVALKKFS